MLLYCLNILAFLIFQFVIWLQQDFICQLSNLAHQIGLKILYNFEEKKSAQSDYFFKGFTAVFYKEQLRKLISEQCLKQA